MQQETFSDTDFWFHLSASELQKHKKIQRNSSDYTSDIIKSTIFEGEVVETTTTSWQT